jgi:predicted nuclease with TOPRIM domain
MNRIESLNQLTADALAADVELKRLTQEKKQAEAEYKRIKHELDQLARQNPELLDQVTAASITLRQGQPRVIKNPTLEEDYIVKLCIDQGIHEVLKVNPSKAKGYDESQLNQAGMVIEHTQPYVQFLKQ